MRRQIFERNDQALPLTLIALIGLALVVSNPTTAQAASSYSPNREIRAVRDTSTTSSDDMAILYESKPLVTRAGAWHTWNDHIHLKPGQEKLPLRITFLNGSDGRAKFTDLRVQLERKPFATLKDFEGTDRVSFDLSYKLTSGNTPVTVQGFGPSGGRLSWKLFVQRPSIAAVKPNLLGSVDRVSVQGKNFSEHSNHVKVLVGSKSSKILSTTGTEVQIKPPDHLPSGDQDLIVAVQSVESKPFRISVKSNPQVKWIDFLSTAPGQTITISGLGFSTISSENIVTFGSVNARIVSATASSITCIVPELHFPQWHVPIVVTTNGIRSKEKASINLGMVVVPNEGVPMR